MQTDHELLVSAKDKIEMASAGIAFLMPRMLKAFHCEPKMANDLDHIQKLLQSATAAVLQLNERSRGVRPPKDN